MRPASTRSSVDLPLPLRPTRQARSPRPRASETPSKVGRPPKVRIASFRARSGGNGKSYAKGLVGSECEPMGERPTGDETLEVVAGAVGQPALAEDAHAAREMTRDQQVRAGPQRVVARQRLGVGDVEPGAGDPAGAERAAQGRLIDDAAARDIDEDCALLARVERR